MDYEESGLTDEELSLIPDITDADEPSPAIDLPYPMDQGFYLVKLESLSDCNIKHYVAQHDASKNVGELNFSG